MVSWKQQAITILTPKERDKYMVWTTEQCSSNWKNDFINFNEENIFKTILKQHLMNINWMQITYSVI
jgi:hypothetical protein